MSAVFARPVFARFLPATTRQDALVILERLAAQGFAGLITWLGPPGAAAGDCDRACDEYLSILGDAPSRLDLHVSIDPLQLGLALDARACERRIARIARALPAGSLVGLAMPSAEHTDATIGVFRRLCTDHGNVAICLQANLARTPADLARLLPVTPHVCLCRGGFTADGTGRRPAVRQRFLDLARMVLDANVARLHGASTLGLDRSAAAPPRLVVASHDRSVVAGVRGLAAEQRVDRADVEFQVVYGVRSAEADRLRGEGYRVRVLVSYGPRARRWLVTRLVRHPGNLRYLLARG